MNPVLNDPWTSILDAVAAKIADTDNSFHKYLVSVNPDWTPKIYDQRGDDNLKNGWDPPLSQCPAVVLMGAALPPVDDHGIGDERWNFTLAVMFKMELPGQDAEIGNHACWELIRTVMHNHRTAQLDPIGSVAGVGDYRIDGELTPLISAPQAGKRVCRFAFVINFRFNATVLG